VTAELPEADASYQASCQVLIAMVQQVVDAAFEEQVSAAANWLRTVVDSITATKSGADRLEEECRRGGAALPVAQAGAGPDS
jgi:hypothetical protein